LFLGAQLFSAIERPAEQIIIDEMSKTRKDFLEKYPCVKGLKKCRKNNSLFFFYIQRMISNRLLSHYWMQINMEWMHEQTLQRKLNMKMLIEIFVFISVDNWSFAQSFFFAVTVVTTIGYDNSPFCFCLTSVFFE
jgi:hypothetical protein